MPDIRNRTLHFRIPKEAFFTGITDAFTFNAAMDWIDALLNDLGGNWKAPVPAAVNLPMLGNSNGDARVTLDTAMIWVWYAPGNNWIPIGNGVYAGHFEQAFKPTPAQIPDGWWGFWWDTSTSELWQVRNRGGTMYGVELTAFP